MCSLVLVATFNQKFCILLEKKCKYHAIILAVFDIKKFPSKVGSFSKVQSALGSWSQAVYSVVYQGIVLSHKHC